ncbi:MAG TPA: T9SS type A sorting domain-containing protein, partial [Chryseolinea sp.]|nr:T9SS type A sorting domain-containing protein [Chryseolinea sp.]
SGQSGIVVINKGTSEQTASINIQNFGYGSRYFVYTLTGGTDNGGFSRKVFVNGHGPTLASGGPSDVETIKANGMLISDGVKITAPPRSINYVLIENDENVITSAEPDLEDLIVVYPNPSPGLFHVVLPLGGRSRIRLTDINGKNIFETELDEGQTSVDVKTNSTSGIFILHIEKDGKIYHRKVELK